MVLATRDGETMLDYSQAMNECSRRYGSSPNAGDVKAYALGWLDSQHGTSDFTECLLPEYRDWYVTGAMDQQGVR